MVIGKKRKIESYSMDMLDSRGKQHSKHAVLRNEDLIIKKNDYRKKRNIESYLMNVDLRGKQHSKHAVLRNEDLIINKKLL
jgi:hypothetical protein